MDEEYVAFLLLESLYKSGKINKPTYENVLKEKRKYIEKSINKRMWQYEQGEIIRFIGKQGGDADQRFKVW